MVKRALITGGASGIGLEIARRFRDGGVDVIVAGRNIDRLKESGFAYVEMDVTHELSVVRGVEDAGPVDIMVCNAGLAETAPVAATSLELWEAMLAVNLTGAFLCARATLPKMAASGWGRFIAVGSTASIKGYAYTGAYAAAKHGLLGLVKTIAIEYARKGVTANSICPGYTDTDLVARSVAKVAKKTGRPQQEIRDSFAAANPIGRLIKPAEVAAAALYLAGDDAATVNGQTLVIDGGETTS